jgi:putative membrane protein
MPSDDPSARRSVPSTLHPVSVLIGVPLLQLVRALVIPAFAVLAGGRGGDRTPVLLLVLVLVGLGVRVLAWQRFRWSFDGDVVRVEQGLLSRSRRVVGVDRIQQVELDRPFVQRLLGVATLRIETAGSDAGPEVELRVLRLDEALTLRAALQPHRPVSAATAATGPAAERSAVAGPSTEVVLRLPLHRVALASVTGAQLLLAPALLLGAVQLAGERADELLLGAADRLVATLDGGPAPGLTTWAAGGAALLVASIVTTLVVAAVRDGGFTVVRVGDDLVLRRGLLGTRESTVPLRRVQVVRVAANPLRRALGVAQLRIHSAGGSAGGSGGGSGSGGDRRAVIPLIAAADIGQLVTELLPAIDALPVLRPHPPAARRRALWRRLRGLAGWAVPAAIGWTLLAMAVREGVEVPLPPRLIALLAGEVLTGDAPAWVLPLVAIGLLVVAQTVLAGAEYRALGHGLGPGVLAARRGALTHVTSVAPLGRLQAVTLRRTWFQSRRGLATVWAHVAGPGGDVIVVDMDASEAQDLHDVLASAAAGAVRPPAGS